MIEDFSNIRVRPYKHERDKEQVGWLSLTFKGVLILSSIKIRRDQEGKYVLIYPGREAPNGHVYYTFEPADEEFRQELYMAVLPAIQNELGY